MKKLFWLLGLSVLIASLSMLAACGDDDDDDDDDEDADDDGGDDDASGIDCEGACAKALDCVEQEVSDLGALRSVAEQECITMCEDEGTQEIYDCVMESSCEILVEDMCDLPIEDYMV